MTSKSFFIEGNELFLDAQGVLRDKDGNEINEEWVKEHVW